MRLILALLAGIALPALAASAQEQARFNKAVAAAAVVKRHLRNPDSVVWESIRANDDASVICLEYRAQNGFGGMTRSSLAVIKSTPSSDDKVWNRHCARPLYDLTPGAERWIDQLAHTPQ